MASIHIDGKQGEGGGQVVRSAVALSLITGKSVQLTNIRARRDRPGLQRQHLTAVRAAATVGNAQLEGDRLGASSLTFHPQPATDQATGYVSKDLDSEAQTPAGQSASCEPEDSASTSSDLAADLPAEFHFRIGTAGSTTLVAQALLPALLQTSHPVSIRLEGGTHNIMAPPYDYLASVYVPRLRDLGFQVECRIHRYGFYPAGGGEIQIDVLPPSTLRPLELLERGKRKAIQVRGLVANLPKHIAERECQTVSEVTHWGNAEHHVEVLQGVHGPGNVLLIETEFEHVTELFCGFGQKGVRAEAVARAAAREAKSYLKQDAPVGPHLSDQLLLPLALVAAQGAGTSTFRMTERTDHFDTHTDVIQAFLPVKIQCDKETGGAYSVRVGKDEG